MSARKRKQHKKEEERDETIFSWWWVRGREVEVLLSQRGEAKKDNELLQERVGAARACRR